MRTRNHVEPIGGWCTLVGGFDLLVELSLEATSFRAIRSSRAVMSEVWLAVTSHTSLDVICQQANEAHSLMVGAGTRVDRSSPIIP